MADTAISALTAASALTGTEEIPLSDGTATTKACTATQIKTFVNTANVFAAGSASASTWPKLTSGTVMTTAEAGALEYDGKVFYATPDAGDRAVWMTALFRAINAGATGSDSATAQGWFPTSGAVDVAGSTCYYFEGALNVSRAAGGTSHTTGVSMNGGTCTFNQIGYWIQAKEGDAATISDGDQRYIGVATDTNFKAASTSTTENFCLQVWGIAWINAAGTFKPMFKYSAAPGGAPTINLGTYFRMVPIGSTGGITVGTWT